MATEISESTKIQLDLKTVGLIIFFSISMAGTYFRLSAQIDQAMLEPAPEVSKIEFSYKDKLTRSVVEGVQADVNTIKDDITEIKESLAKMEERLYDLSR